ncbi:MAG: L,D-transpeptidase family protein [Flavobacterium sp.]
MYKKIFFVLFIGSIFSCKKEALLSFVEVKKEILPEITFQDIKDSLLFPFYKNNNYQLFWKDSLLRNQMINTIKNIEEEGMFLKDFDWETIKKYEKNIKNFTKKDSLEYDLLLTNNLKKYIQIGFYGKVNPRLFYKDYDLEIDTIAVPRILEKFRKNKNIDSLQNNVFPNHSIYKNLKLALKEFKDVPIENIKQLKFTQKYLPDSTYTAIKEIKERLVYKQIIPDSSSFTNIYDSLTVLAVKKFQKDNQLNADGIIGQSTIDALNFTKDVRKKQIIANMERWRWYPRKMATNYVLINLPQYQLWAVNDNDTISKHKVIIGKISRKTPVLSSLIDKVTINPTWTVPPTILKEDLKPAASRNRGYFKRKGLTIYKNGKKVSPSSWNPAKASSYSYVQNPGSSNALGIVKLSFKNRFLVYLHDTSNRKLYSNNQRALSSGCVRVDEPLKLAQIILNDTVMYATDSIEKIIKTRKTKNIEVSSNYMVYQWYWTANYLKGKPVFYEDVYRLDLDLYQQMYH